MNAARRAVGIGYANARLRGARTTLLSSTEIEALVNQPNLDSLIAALTALPTYQSHMDDAALTSSGTRLVTLALRSRLGEVYSFVDGMLDDKHRRLTDILVSMWDFRDLKTIVRGTTAGVSPEETVESIIGVGVHIAREDIMALARQTDLDGVVRTTATLELPYSSALSAAYRTYKQDGSLISLELALDRAWATAACVALAKRPRRAAAAVVHDVVAFEIDLTNLLTALRAGAARTPVDDLDGYFLPGGSSFGRHSFHTVANIDDPLTALDSLPNNAFGSLIDSAADAYVMHGRLSAIERSLRATSTTQFIKQFGRDALGLGVAISYLLAVENEVQNIRVIAYGTRFAMPADTIRQELIGV